MARSSQFEFRFTGVDKGVKKTLNGIEGDLDGFGKKAGRFAVGVAGAFAAAFAVDKLVDFGKTLFTLGNDVAVWELKASTVFGSNADAVRQWADSVNESMGISDERVVGLAAAMGDILVPMGATRSEAAKLSMEMVGLAPKLAIMAGSSYDTAQVAEILSDALRGEKDALSGLGLPLTQAAVDTRALELAQADGRKEIDQFDKAIATSQLIMEGSADTISSWNDESLDQIKAVNTLKAAWEDFQIELSNWVIPVTGQGLVWLTETALPALQEFFFNPEPTFDVEGLMGGGILPEPEPGQGTQWIFDIKNGISELKEEVEGLAEESGGISTMWEPFQEGGNMVWATNAAVVVLNTTIALGQNVWDQMKLIWGVALPAAMTVFRTGVDLTKLVGEQMVVIWNGVGDALGWTKDQFVKLKDALAGGLPSIPNPFSGFSPSGILNNVIPDVFNAAGSYVDRPMLSMIGEGGQGEFVINASQMRGLAREGISVGGNNNGGGNATTINVHVAGSVVAEYDLAALINRLTRDQMFGGSNSVLGVA